MFTVPVSVTVLCPGSHDSFRFPSTPFGCVRVPHNGYFGLQFLRPVQIHFNCAFFFMCI